MAPKYEVLAQITGTRNGEDWPAPGGIIELPKEEAADYVAAGLIREPKKAEKTEKASSPKPDGHKPIGKAGRARGRGAAKAPETATAPPPDTATAHGDPGPAGDGEPDGDKPQG